jgi:transcriptional regulator with XRE-family HTH domain
MGDVGYGSYLSQIERGNNTPRRETLIKIAVGYDVDVSLLLRLVGYIDREEAGL